MRTARRLVAALATLFLVAGCGVFGPEPPAKLREAADSSEWATAQIKELPRRTGSKTVGRLFLPSGGHRDGSSGEDGEFRYASSVLRGSTKYKEASRDTQRGLLAAASHVEVKASALMRKEKISYAVLLINNAEGPCASDIGGGCVNAMPIVLPKGYRLMMWWPDNDGNAQGPKPFDGADDQ